MKEPKCKICGKTGHYAAFCYNAPKKPIKSSPISSYKRVSATPKPKSISELYKKQTALKTPVSQRKRLIQKLDTVFSKYIRLRYAVEGMVQCVTCGRKDNWKNMDCGHFIPRGRMGTRFDERNCHVQCKDCNQMKSGNMEKYNYYMKVWYGDDVIAELLKKSREPLKTYEIQEMITHYREKVLTFK